MTMQQKKKSPINVRDLAAPKSKDYNKFSESSQ